MHALFFEKLSASSNISACTLMCEDTVKITEIEVKIMINNGIQLIRERNVYKLLFMFGYLLSVKMSKFNVLHNL